MNDVINNVKDAMIPLANDEMNFFKNIFTPKIDVGEPMNKIIELLEGRNSYLSSIENLLGDLLTTINNKEEFSISNLSGISTTNERHTGINPIFTTTLSGTKKNEWIYNNVSCINEKFPGKDPKYALGEIYTEMKNRNGYDVYDLLDEYKKDKTESVSIIDMVVNSDVLRLSYELCVNKLIEKNKPIVTKIVPPSYKEAHACPSEIRGIISSLSPTGRPTGRHYNKAKDIIKTYSGYNIKKMTRETKKKYKIKSCGEWFAISQYPELVNYLREEISKARMGA